ncbi:hypothetical protein RI367_000500 [Sorochytrium milnesiophthora]
MADLTQFYALVDKDQDHYVDLLRQAVAIPSVSGDAAYRPDTIRMQHWMQEKMQKLGIETRLHHPGKQTLEGKELDLPPIILGKYGSDEGKRTVLLYAHTDAQPSLKSDGWNTDPWTLTEDDKGQMFGRGSTDDKAHQKLGLELPVNIKFCFEAMEESGSEGLDELIIAEAKKYFANVDCVCISDNYWLGTTKPCLTYGLRGISYFTVAIQGPGWDLHSGVYGGTVHEPMTDLIQLMSRLVTPAGKILIPGINDNVAALTDEERKIYDSLDFSLNELQSCIGAKNNIYDDVPNTLMHRWRYPSLSLHGIEGAFYSPGAKTVIPARVVGKFSIRTVPNQTPEEISQKVTKYLNDEFAKLGTKNKLTVESLHGGKAWVADVNHWNFVAGAKATEQVYGVKPDLTREGGSIPVTLTFQEALGKSVLLLPMGRSDDGAHSINEKLDRSNYIKGIKLMGTYLHEIAKNAK